LGTAVKKKGMDWREVVNPGKIQPRIAQDWQDKALLVNTFWSSTAELDVRAIHKINTVPKRGQGNHFTWLRFRWSGAFVVCHAPGCDYCF